MVFGWVHNSFTPVSLHKGIDAWRILFNNDETYATIALHELSGKQIYHKQLTHIRRGQETTISFTHLPAGTYLLHINTTLGAVTRKVIVC